MLDQWFFFFNDTATTEIYTLSLHDALPISARPRRSGPPPVRRRGRARLGGDRRCRGDGRERSDRKSTRLNSSHANISYAVFCLKKKKKLYYVDEVYACESLGRLQGRTRRPP